MKNLDLDMNGGMEQAMKLYALGLRLADFMLWINDRLPVGKELPNEVVDKYVSEYLVEMAETGKPLISTGVKVAEEKVAGTVQ